MRGRLALLAFVAVLGAAAACAEAGGHSTGGEVTPAGEQATVVPVAAGTVDPNGICVAPDAGRDGGGTTFTDLYIDIFGKQALGGCAYQVSCHGTADGDGAQDNAGLQCYPDKSSCRKSLLERNLIVPGQGTQGVLFNANGGILRTPQNPGAGEPRMPKAPAGYVMPQSCVDRIQAWIAAGAPDN